MSGDPINLVAVIRRNIEQGESIAALLANYEEKDHAYLRRVWIQVGMQIQMEKTR